MHIMPSCVFPGCSMSPGTKRRRPRRWRWLRQWRGESSRTRVKLQPRTLTSDTAETWFCVVLWLTHSYTHGRWVDPSDPDGRYWWTWTGSNWERWLIGDLQCVSLAASRRKQQSKRMVHRDLRGKAPLSPSSPPPSFFFPMYCVSFVLSKLRSVFLYISRW